MALNLQIDRPLDQGGDIVKDENGNPSLLTLGPESIGIRGTFSVATMSVTEFGPGPSTVLFLRRDEAIEEPRTEEGPALNVHFILDPTNRVFNLDIGGQNNQRARIHLGDPEKATNRVTTLGSVGIGTTDPTEQLEVHGNILATGDVRLAGADCAEDFEVEELTMLEPGMVMVIGNEERLYRCNQAYDRRVAGVLSGAGDCRPGIVLGKQPSQGERLPLALNGKVYCKVDADYMSIEVGDLLTTSPTPGHAMKASDASRAFGTVIGKALRPLAEGTGLVPILVSLQ